MFSVCVLCCIWTDTSTICLRSESTSNSAAVEYIYQLVGTEGPRGANNMMVNHVHVCKRQTGVWFRPTRLCISAETVCNTSAEHGRRSSFNVRLKFLLEILHGPMLRNGLINTFLVCILYANQSEKEGSQECWDVSRSLGVDSVMSNVGCVSVCLVRVFLEHLVDSLSRVRNKLAPGACKCGV